jgi:SAM-dependent methyltransferase
MTRLTSATRSEFDVVAGWTADAIERLGPRHAVPGACRGSGHPEVLRWLVRGLELRASSSFVDIGGGLGGPAAWAAEQTGVTPRLIEPMPIAATRAAGLFGLSSTVGDAEHLPLRRGSLDAAWMLAVLDTTDDAADALTELAAALRPGGRLGLLEYLATTTRTDVGPDDNTFLTRAGLGALLDAAGLTVTAELEVTASAPTGWQRLVDEVTDEVRAAHQDDRRWQAARAHEQDLEDLLDRGLVRPVAFIAHGSG